MEKLTEKDLITSAKLTPKSTKVIIRLLEPEFRDLDDKGIIIPESAKSELREQIAFDDIPKYLKAHPHRGIVISVGEQIKENENISIGDIVYLRTLPGSTDFILFNNSVYYSIDNAMILCYESNGIKED